MQYNYLAKYNCKFVVPNIYIEISMEHEKLSYVYILMECQFIFTLVSLFENSRLSTMEIKSVKIFILKQLHHKTVKK